MESLAVAPPIFLHGLWRSGSTYVWSRFRAVKSAYSYFEQLYPGLARMTPSRLRQGAWRDAVAANRHPELEEPYFAEFSPLLSRRGVKGFDRRFAFDRFALGAGDQYPALERYLGGLIGYAAAQDRRAVLGCNRTWLRPAWIKARFGSYDVHVERDPVAIWSSYKRHAETGNYNYFTNLHLILERNGHHPLFAPIADRVRLRRGLERFTKAPRAYPALIARMSDAESYGLVYYLWSLSILSGLRYCDLIVDTGAPSMATRAAAAIKADSGLDIDFSGIRPIHPIGLAAPLARAVEGSIRSILPFDALSETYDELAVTRRLGDLSDSKADQVFALLDGMKSVRGRAASDVRAAASSPLKAA
jgi:hypothetical protein